MLLVGQPTTGNANATGDQKSLSHATDDNDLMRQSRQIQHRLGSLIVASAPDDARGLGGNDPIACTFSGCSDLR